MDYASGVEKLGDKRYVSAVLRLVVDRRGRLAQGDLVDVEGRVQSHFAGWRGLTRALQAWLAEQGRQP